MQVFRIGEGAGYGARCKPASHNEVKWTNEEVATLRHLWEQGLSGSKIGATLNRTRSSVLGKLKRLGWLGAKASTARQEAKRIRERKERREREAKRVAINALPKPPAVKETRKAVDEPEPLYTMETDRGEGCRWICGDPKTAQALVCGHKRAFRAWCEHHARRVYQPTAKREATP